MDVCYPLLTMLIGAGFLEIDLTAMNDWTNLTSRTVSVLESVFPDIPIPKYLVLRSLPTVATHLVVFDLVICL